MTESNPVTHIPIREMSRGFGDEHRRHAACSCGHVGPGVPPGQRPIDALHREHPLDDPSGCMLCGHPAEKPDLPWIRYEVKQVDGEWLYACRDSGSCQQRQRSPLPTNFEPWDYQGDPLTWIDEPPTTFTVSLNTSGADVMSGISITEAIAHYQLARGASPRTWAETTETDRHSLIALVTAVTALHEAADLAQRFAIVSTRKAGATWDDLALAAGDDDAKSFRDWCNTALFDNYYEWPDHLLDEINALIAEPPAASD